MKKRTNKQICDDVQEKKFRLNEIKDALTAEKREMTPEETQEFHALTRDLQALSIESMTNNVIAPKGVEVRDAGLILEKIVEGIKNRDIPEEYRSFVLDGKDIVLRDAVVQDSGTVGAITPLTIGEVIQPLEQGLILGQVGLKMQYGMGGAWQFPIVAGVTAKLVGEDVKINDSKIDIDKIAPSPKRISIRIPVTYQAINRGTGKILEIVKTQISMSLTRVLNQWMFSQEKLAGTDGGCFVQAKTKVTGTGNYWKDAIKLKGEVMKTGIVFDGTPAYVCSAVTYAEMESTPRDAGSGLMVIENGKLNGLPVYITEFIGDGCLGFGVFSYMLVGQFGTLRLTVDPYTQADQDRIVFTLNTEFDMLPLRKEAFGLLTFKEGIEGAKVKA